VVLKEVLTTIKDFAEPCPPLKASLAAVVREMDMVDRVCDVDNDFTKVASKIEGFYAIFSQFRSKHGFLQTWAIASIVFQLNSLRSKLWSGRRRATAAR